ncbi:hypothetical protein ZYGR_0P03590 [Zygosaccharomyces rouxii]|uniref:ZYRO0E08778p n=2 Tax=Zygosaccharomyces rouxii TaxID=4956 RepID=C5E4U2_ZYGRC|nr:uncharacterized protein ZYRO0E08778g [Zygosaccharomyces rouxii]KAH9198091.1 hypothetical protein LQ764DRAFT_146584 [Zygosaccharomyces rouxii]GAV49713.1 hypothetical protein ZYGR_0P03590 [Zygosaccharomyces rouxii]CAR31053.1 ZYRO0E08778p [Zygosaccharomyces rouxii]
MSTDAMYMNSPHVLRASGKHTNRTSHVTKLDKQRIQQNDKGSNKSKNGQVAISVPKTQVLPNGEKPDFGNSNSTRKSKNGTQKKGGAKEQKDVTKGLRSLRLPDEKTKSSRQQQQKEKETQSTKSQSSRPRSNSNASAGLNSSSTPISSTPPTVPTSPLEKPAAAIPNVTPLMAPGAIPVPPPLTGLPNLMPNSIPHPLPPPPTGVQPLPMQPPLFGGPGYPYGNYAVRPMPYMNPQTPSPVVSQMYPQIPLPMMQMQMQMPQVNSDTEAQTTMMQTTMMTAKPSATSTSSCSNSRRPTTTKSTSFAGASFASKDPVINKLPKPSFA